ncbi:hypothetical protein [Kitasatospora sp. GP82]|uniref:hypothetical protein n=1 Tax=Kitasatospora sp. GP82 TaxID=3035089 RepID=UPI002473A2AD|nr:hypothetical protein [Kitasatospora sp. GP82]MDH6130031.1 hypothetical protein [Kitasatospora sp. GP82]
MNALRFDAGVGTFAVNVRENSLWVHKAMGTHSLELQLEVHIPQSEGAGRLLVLETDLFAPRDAGPRAWLGAAAQSIAFTPGGVERPTLRFLLTGAQLLALEESRTGDLRLELDVRAVLPQMDGYPGASQATEHISIAESRWRQQLAGLGRSLGVEMTIPFPSDDEPGRAAADFLREARRLLGGNEIDPAMLMVRKALETIKNISGWNWPGKKDKGQARSPQTSAGLWPERPWKTRPAAPCM